MKKSITFTAVENSGVNFKSNFYWNGSEFITTCKALLPVETIETQFAKATEWLKNNLPLVSEFPESYNLRIA